MTVKAVNVATGDVAIVEMTADELASITAVKIRSVAAEIDALERQHLMPRAQREFMLTYMETEAAKAGAEQGLTPEQSVAVLRARNAGYRKVKELDEQIAALRGLL
jgi:hypothetical protein